MRQSIFIFFTAFIISCLFPTTANAGEFQNVLITDIRFNNVNSTFLIKFSSGTNDPLPTCATNEYPVALYYPNNVVDTQRLMYEMLMHAFTYNRRVDVFFSGGCVYNSDSATVLRVAVHR